MKINGIIKLFKKPERDVSFADREELKYILSPFNAQQYEIINKIIDKYINNSMKEHIKNKINWNNIDEDLEVKLRWVLEFKDFFNKINEEK